MRWAWALVVVVAGAASCEVLAAADVHAAVVTGVSPAVVAAGSGATVIDVTGSGFTSGDQVRVSGVIVSTVYVDPGMLTATVPSLLLASDQSAAVDSIGPGGEVSSGAVVLTVGAGGDPEGLTMDQWHTVVFSLLGGLGAYLFVAGVGRAW